VNTRPTNARAPAPPVDEAHFVEVQEDRPNRPPLNDHVNHQPPAVRAQQQSNSMPSEGPVQQPDLPITAFGKLAGAIAAVMAEIKPVEKAGFNKFHDYKYAKMGDLSIELTPLMGKHGIVVFQNEVDRMMFDDNKVISVRYQFTIVHSSGEIWPERPLITGMSRCRDSKGGFDDKSFNKAHTAARKYFLLSLFQIPTDDERMDDADAPGGDQRQRPTAQRRAPSPDGKVSPHLIPIEEGDTTITWGDKFIKAIANATPTEVDLWYDVNHVQFLKVQKAGDSKTYERLVEAMDARAAGDAFTEKQQDPISSGPPGKATDTHTSTGTPRAPRQRAAPPPKDDSFPGDTPMVKHGNHPDPMDAFNETQWFEALENACAACEDTDQLIEAQTKYQVPYKEQVSKEGWTRAVGIIKVHLKRLQEAAK
jgi:hypothetical protein